MLSIRVHNRHLQSHLSHSANSIWLAAPAVGQMLLQPFVSGASSCLSGGGCGRPLDSGPCRQYVVRWYYDREANSCAQFWFGGCQGNANNFESEADCKHSCVVT